jgi:hypothetical protein
MKKEKYIKIPLYLNEWVIVVKYNKIPLYLNEWVIVVKYIKIPLYLKWVSDSC